MKKNILITSLALLLAAFLWGCQKQASSPVEPEGKGIIPLAKTGDGKVYELVETPLTWVAANAAARRMVAEGCRSAHLATITSQDEQDLIADLMTGVESNAWIGGSQGGLSLDKNWHWITGEKFVYTNWGGGEPNDNPFGTFIPGSEQYLEIQPQPVLGAWNDAPGFEEKFFVVESEHCIVED